jgi:hypothetical protein
VKTATTEERVVPISIRSFLKIFYKKKTFGALLKRRHYQNIL